MRRRATLDSFGLGGRDHDPSPAPTVGTYAGYHVGQAVMVHQPIIDRRIFIGTIRKLVMTDFWKFAVVEDGLGGHHACDISELA